MSWNGGLAQKGILLVLPVVIVMGCTGSQTIAPGKAPYAIEVVASPPVSAPHTFASVNVSQVLCLPTDPQQLAVLGGDKIFGLLAGQPSGNLLSSEITQLDTRTLTAGEYEIQRVDLAFKLSTAPAGQEPDVSTCARVEVGEYEYEGVPEAIVSEVVELVPPPGSRFGVSEDGSGRVRIAIDGTALAALLHSRAACVITGFETIVVGEEPNQTEIQVPVFGPPDELRTIPLTSEDIASIVALQ